MSDMTTNWQRLNAMDDVAAMAALTRCCGAHRWVMAMLDRRPFQGAMHLLLAAEEIWGELSEEDWLEAFSHHPKIGDISSLRAKFQDTLTWAEHEQSAVKTATDDILEGLAQGNRDYEKKFGFIFIVCATGKRAHEMLDLLQQRLPHTRDEELLIAATEQLKITRLRLEKL